MNLTPVVTTMIDGVSNNVDLINYDFIKNRIIYVRDEIDTDLSVKICSQIRYLSKKSDKDIYIIINSRGGSVNDGLAIWDAMLNSRCDIQTIATGTAASMGAFLLAMGTKGKRFATKNAEIMIHQPLGGAQGQATDIMVVAEHIQKIKFKMANALSNATNRPREKLLQDMERDFWMTSDEAKEYGIIDAVGFPEVE